MRSEKRMNIGTLKSFGWFVAKLFLGMVVLNAVLLVIPGGNFLISLRSDPIGTLKGASGA